MDKQGKAPLLVHGEVSAKSWSETCTLFDTLKTVRDHIHSQNFWPPPEVRVSQV